MKHLIFISWSGSLSKQVAFVLKKFLSRVLDLKHETDIFVSSQNLTGDSGIWFQEIIDHASSTSIFIPCITKDSIKSPWLHFEAGIGACIKAYPIKTIPFLFNLSLNEMKENLEMYRLRQMVHSDNKNYTELLCQLVYYVSTFLDGNSSLKEMISISNRRYESFDLNKIKNDYERQIRDAASELENVAVLYGRKFYISRPIQGTTKEESDIYENVLEEMSEMASKEFSYSTYFSKRANQGNIIGMSFDRLGVLKETQYFILVYPKIEDKNVAPSSCFIELGGALAYGKHIVMFVQRGSVVPAFVTDLMLLKYKYYEYEDVDDLKKKWRKFLEEIKKNEYE